MNRVEASPRDVRQTLVPHLVWEGVLFVLTIVAMLIALLQADFRIPVGFWINIASLGLLATAFSVSLRLAPANLAVGAIAALSGAVFAKLVIEDLPALVAGPIAVALVLVVGAVLGAITGLTKAPGWIVSLAPFALIPPILVELVRGRGLTVTPILGRPEFIDGLIWTVLFGGLSVVGGALLILPQVRRFLAAQAFVAALIGFTLSSLLAGLSGIVWTLSLGISPASADTGRVLLAVAAVVLGGVSVFGGRGGVLGTVLGVLFLTFVNLTLARNDAPTWVTSGLVPAVAILVGIAVSWLFSFLERQMAGRPAGPSGLVGPAGGTGQMGPAGGTGQMGPAGGTVGPAAPTTAPPAQGPWTVQ